jgi:malate synthase
MKRLLSLKGHNRGITLEITRPIPKDFSSILTVDAIDFLIHLHINFEHKRRNILAERQKRNQQLRNGIMPDFLSHTKNIRDSSWIVDPVPKDLINRKAEICAPVENRKLVFDAVFNSGATGFMADFDDAHCPSWHNVLYAQINLRDAINGSLKKEFKVESKIVSKAVIFCRPRSWNLPESHFKVNGIDLGGGIFDFGLYMFHNAKVLIEQGSGPYFYLTKLENHLEARLWNEIFIFAQDYLHIPRGTIKACALIENIMAVFEMNEILYELREHSCGLNSGMWDYVFSYISKFHHDKKFVLPDRSFITMQNCKFLKLYGDLLVKTCHKRGTYATGGMAPMFLRPEEENDLQLCENLTKRVKDAKMGDALRGNDGALVAHKNFVPALRSVFDQVIGSDKPHQRHVMRYDVGEIKAFDLIEPPNDGKITEEGLKSNINIALRYIESWLNDYNGFMPLNNIVEDAATAEISRSLVWQWVHHKQLMESRLGGQSIVNIDAVKLIISEIVLEEGNTSRFDEATRILVNLTASEEFPEFMTLLLYEHVLQREKHAQSKL